MLHNTLLPKNMLPNTWLPNTLIAKFALTLLLVLSCTGLQAELKFENAWIRQLPPVVATTAAYVTITSSEADRLVRISSDIAQMTELHQSKAKNGVMSMDYIASLGLAAGETISLKPGSYHIMLMHLKKPLKPDDKHSITLEFEKAGKKTVIFTVKP